VLASALAGIACSARTTDATKHDGGLARAGTEPDAIADLRPFEEETRRSFDFANPPSAETGMGADPWAIRRVASGFVGILRGRSALVLLDDALREVARIPTPRSPTGLAIGKSGEILVASELSPVLARFAVRGTKLEPLGDVVVPGVLGLRDIAVSPAGIAWALDERGGRLLRLALGASGRTPLVVASIPVGHGAVQVVATANHVVVDAVLDHTIVVVATDASGVPTAREPLRITHDGPMWGFDARETSHGLVIAAGGVEDHPLDRRGAFFGYIDSFVFAYRVHDATIEKLAAINVSEHGVITPKAVALEGTEGDRVDVLVTAYGSAAGITVGIAAAAEPVVAPIALVPGIRAVERSGARTTVMADPLLDAWIARDETGVRVVPVPSLPGEKPRSPMSRLGEALFFTSLMAPKNTSEGALSRFTCETCHFEGYVDGRTHHTGREEIHATTKPLVGLVGNRPYFSRALDPDLSTVSHAEFRVAGAGSATDPFFAVEPRDHAWLEHVGVRERVEPLELRRALLRFLVDFSHRPSPAVVARLAKRASFTPLEREGAGLFRDRCESCHAARLSADDPASQVAFERWEAMILAEAAPIVWGSAGYKKTGIVPYVHEDGARTPSLRRLYKKYPYFTNGSARSLDDILDRLRFVDAKTLHASENGERLDDTSKRALKAFLDLL
jgi:hypothetical protein